LNKREFPCPRDDPFYLLLHLLHLLQRFFRKKNYFIF